MPWPTASHSAARILRSCFATSKLAIVAELAILMGCAKHYRADGMLLRADAARQTVFISHRDIEGYMPAMAMEFRAKHVPDLAPGARITFELAVKHGNAVVTHIASRGGVAEFTTPASLAVGSPVPDFTLIDPKEKPVSLSSLRGEVVALNFIYTRCPQPDVCPRLSANFARLQRRFGRSVKLLSITIDPRYDNASVLDRYAKLWNADQESWHFLTGSERQIRAVASTFGLVYFAEDGSMTHSSRTAVIGRDGRLAGMVEGSAFAVSQLGDLISMAMEAR